MYLIQISDDPRRYEPGATLQHEDGRTLTLESSRPHRDRFLAKFEGIDTRNEAEGLRGALYVAAEDARTLEVDEYWPQDLIGATVVDVEGASIGEVSGVIPGSAQDLLEVATPRGPRLVPMVKDIVQAVDAEAGRVVVSPPKGLFD